MLPRLPRFRASSLVLLTAALPAFGPQPAAALPAWHWVIITRPPGAAPARPDRTTASESGADPTTDGNTPPPTFSGSPRFAAAPLRISPPGLGEGEVTIEAGDVTQEGGRMVATGGVTLTQGSVRLTAEKMTGNSETGEVVAEGNVVFTEPGRTVRGQRIIYNTDSRQLRAEAAETVVQGVILRAREIGGGPARYRVSSASVTTCDLPHPHYQFTARAVDIIPNDRIIARHVGVWLLGVRLFVVPRLEARIGTGRGEGGTSPFPSVGSNSRDGFFLEKVLPIVEQPRLYLDLDARLSARRALTGGFDAAAPAGGSGLQWFGALKYRDEAPNQRTRFLEVDRIPEVGLLWVSPAPAPPPRRRPSRRRAPSTPGAPAAEAGAPAATTETAYRPLSLVGADVAHQPGLLQPPERGRWYLRAQTTLGYFHQRATSILGGRAESRSRSRLDLRATASRAGIQVAGISLPVVQLFLRHSFYDDGNSFTVFGFAARQDWRMGPHWSSALRAFFHQTTGQTPFRFDRVEIRTELQPAFTYRVGGTTLGWLGRMDLDRRQLFDQEFSIGRVFHCLEPRLSYHTRRRQVSVDLHVVGLGFE